MLFVGDVSVQTTPKHRAEVLSSVPNSKKVMMCLLEKVGVSDKLHSGVRSSAVGREFRVSESTMYLNQSVFKQKHTKQGYIFVG